MELLEKTRQISRMMQNASDYTDVACMIRDIVESNTYIVAGDGSIKGMALIREFECDIMHEIVLGNNKFPSDYMNFVMSIRETKANIPHKNQICSFVKDKKCIFKDKKTTVIPLYGNNTRLGTLIVAKYDADFTDEELLLAEFAAALIGMRMYQEQTFQQIQMDREKTMVENAMATLSFSETEAIFSIIGAMEAREGLLVASKVADEVGITRSVIVNALRKFESAGLIETKSLGMKGTYIHILNDLLIDYVKERRRTRVKSSIL